MRVLLSRPIERRLGESARAAAPREFAALVAGARRAHGWVVDRVYAVANTSLHPERAFAVAPEDVLRAHRAAAAEGRGILGTAHSHPAGPSRPSRADAAGAWPGSLLLLIAIGDGQGVLLTAWYRSPDRTAFLPLRIDAGRDAVSYPDGKAP